MRVDVRVYSLVTMLGLLIVLTACGGSSAASSAADQAAAGGPVFDGQALAAESIAAGYIPSGEAGDNTLAKR